MTNLRTQLEELLDRADCEERCADLGHFVYMNRVAILSALEAVEWRSMDSAPLDEVILLFGQLCGQAYDEQMHPSQPVRACGYWDEIDGAWALTDTTWAGPFIEPTHWRPLGPTPEVVG